MDLAHFRRQYGFPPNGQRAAAAEHAAAASSSGSLQAMAAEPHESSQHVFSAPSADPDTANGSMYSPSDRVFHFQDQESSLERETLLTSDLGPPAAWPSSSGLPQSGRASHVSRSRRASEHSNGRERRERRAASLLDRATGIQSPSRGRGSSRRALLGANGPAELEEEEDVNASDPASRGFRDTVSGHDHDLESGPRFLTAAGMAPESASSSSTASPRPSLVARHLDAATAAMQFDADVREERAQQYRQFLFCCCKGWFDSLDTELRDALVVAVPSVALFAGTMLLLVLMIVAPSDMTVFSMILIAIFMLRIAYFMHQRRRHARRRAAVALAAVGGSRRHRLRGSLHRGRTMDAMAPPYRLTRPEIEMLALGLDLAAQDGDFTPNDYDMLRRLDDHPSVARRQGIRQEQIDRLPTFGFKKKELPVDSDEAKCVICIEEFDSGDVVRALPCFHRFHVSCIDTWLLSNGACPICKVRAA